MALKPSPRCHETFVTVEFHDKVPGFLAFEVQMPYQKYQQPPIVVRLNLSFIGSVQLVNIHSKPAYNSFNSYK